MDLMSDTAPPRVRHVYGLGGTAGADPQRVCRSREPTPMQSSGIFALRVYGGFQNSVI
jgi:hypothetical protein